MKVIYGVNRIRKFRKPVVALGVFDGVHYGHKKILEAVVRKAHSIKGTGVVLTFWPHPQKVENLYSLEHRLRLIAELGVDVCIVLNFNKNFAKISAFGFVKNILFRKLKIAYLYVGRNFRFGRSAEGNLKTLRQLSKEYNFQLKSFKVFKIEKRAVSSTTIRTLIKKGDLETARKLLKRPVSILGTVIKGGSLGRKLGFPTANINPHHEVIPPSGVYAVKVIFGSKKINGICNIGIKPTFKTKNKHRKTHIELHILNFNKEIYGKYLEIQFIKKIRDEKRFDSCVRLVRQIKKDIKIIRKLFPTTN